MEQFITSIPNTFFGWIITMIIAVTGLVTGITIIRRNDMKLLRETNEDLRQAHKDNQDKINVLETKIDDMRKEFEQLKISNMTLENLVRNSLIEFFRQNPKEARRIGTQINKS